jgi:diadenosine tetraphosphatase ApaH/serine/threonine PP2A family protein phosphatase
VRYLILADLHANLQALEAVLADAAALGYDRVLVLGDLVGYGADPGAVVDRTMALQPQILIRGNHDKVCAGLDSAEEFNDAARRAVEWTRTALSPAQLRVIGALPMGPRLVTEGLVACHGAPFDEDYYVIDGRDAQLALDASRERICLFGHTHVPGIYVRDPALGAIAAEGDVELRPSGRWLINVGSVGQPRDGDPRAAYGILDTDQLQLHCRRVEYDVVEAQARIRRAGLPHWLADRLAVGR